MDTKELQGIGFFSGLSKQALKGLAQWTAEGTADVIQGGERLTELGPGEFFGEIGLLETERRTASVIATSPMRLIVMFQSQFRQMEREMPTVADRIRSAIRARLDNSPS